MSNEAEQMAAALDGLGINDDPIVGDIEEESDVIEEGEAEEEEHEDENPPGYVSYQEWVDSGKDPDDWQGKKKYSQQYQLIQDNKDFKNELKSMNEMLKQTVQATQSMQDAAYNRGVEQAKAELQDALDNNDAQGVLDAQTKLQNMPQPKAAQQINPVHVEFFASNPIIDSQSDQYDDELMSEFGRIYNGRLQADGVRPDQTLSERAIKGYMNEALKSAKSLFPDKFESPRNTRKTTQSNGKRGTVKSAHVDALKNTKFVTKNTRDTNPAMDIYNSILNAKDGGKDAADKFAQKMGISV